MFVPHGDINITLLLCNLALIVPRAIKISRRSQKEVKGNDFMFVGQSRRCYVDMYVSTYYSIIGVPDISKFWWEIGVKLNDNIFLWRLAKNTKTDFLRQTFPRLSMTVS